MVQLLSVCEGRSYWSNKDSDNNHHDSSLNVRVFFVYTILFHSEIIVYEFIFHIHM